MKPYIYHNAIVTGSSFLIGHMHDSFQPIGEQFFGDIIQVSGALFCLRRTLLEYLQDDIKKGLLRFENNIT